MKAAITAALLNRMIRGLLIGLVVKSMKRIMSPATISALIALAAMLLSVVNSMRQDDSKSQKQKDRVIDIENYSVSD
jgi:hypothetical protein